MACSGRLNCKKYESHELSVATMNEIEIDGAAINVFQRNNSLKENEIDEEVNTEIDSDDCSCNSGVTQNDMNVTVLDSLTVTANENIAHLHRPELTNIMISKEDYLRRAHSDMGTDNPIYSHDSIDNRVPLVTNLQSRAFIDGEITTDEREVDTGKTTTRSTSLPDLSSRIVVYQRNCSCDCHCMNIDQCSNGDDAANTVSAISKLILDFKRLNRSPLSITKKAPSKSDFYLSTQISNISNYSSSSPTSSQAPPTYRSLIFGILKDEPPKYQDVTGKEISFEPVNIQRRQTWNSGRPPKLTTCITGFAIFIGVVIITSVLFYLVESHFHVFKTQGDRRHHRKLVPPAS